MSNITSFITANPFFTLVAILLTGLISIASAEETQQDRRERALKLMDPPTMDEVREMEQKNGR